MALLKRGDGYHLRGRAYYVTKDGAEAEADLTRALPWVSEPRSRDSLLLTLAQNRERNLGDEEGAFEAFNAIVAGRVRIGSADEYGALQGIARIQARRGEYDDALRTLNRGQPRQVAGYVAGEHPQIDRRGESIEARRREVSIQLADDQAAFPRAVGQGPPSRRRRGLRPAHWTDALGTSAADELIVMYRQEMSTSAIAHSK
jgi:tetratricopeptide (TPR) repeat protein